MGWWLGRWMPNPRIEDKIMRKKIEQVLEKIKPFLQADGGDIELVDVENGTVKVRLTGACGSCPASQMTLKMGVEMRLKEEIPEVQEVVAVE